MHPTDPASPSLLRGERVDLRLIEESDLPAIHAWNNDPDFWGPFQAPMPQTLGDLQRRHAERPALSDEFGRLLVVLKDGTPVGSMSYHRVGYGVNSPAFNMGIVLAPEHRGNGYGWEAQRLLADYLLYRFPVGRVEASTDVENIPEQRALERAGFKREGVARSSSFRNGWHDMVVYSRIRGDE